MKETVSWERQPKETAKAFAAFCIYRGMGVQRSSEGAYRLARGVDVNGKQRPPGYWQNWSADFNWVKRAAEWDDHLEREARHSEERVQVRKLREFRIDQQRSAQTASRQALKALQKAGEKLDHLNAEDLKPSEAASFMQAAARLLESAAAQQASALAVDEMLEALTDG